MSNMFDGMFMRVQRGLCMLSPCGIAVKTSAGYRSYNVKTGKLRNCDNMVFSFGDGMFFVKIVYMFGDGASISGKGNITRMMKFMMMSSLFENGGAMAAAGEGTGAGPAGAINMLLPLLLMKNGGFDDLFTGLFEEGEAEGTDSDQGEAPDEDTLF